MKILFQFQYGSIKSAYHAVVFQVMSLFQFQYGSIKRINHLSHLL